MGVKRSEGAKAPLMTFRSLLGFVALTFRRPCVVQRFGNLRDGVQYGAFAAGLWYDLAARRLFICFLLSALGRTKA